MFFKMIIGALFRQKGKMFMVAFTIALGAALSVAMLNTMLGVGDKINMELKSYGANINVLPKDASLLDDIYGLSVDDAKSHKYLKEDELTLVKTIFWGFNIVDFTPYFNTECEIISIKRPCQTVDYENYVEGSNAMGVSGNNQGENSEINDQSDSDSEGLLSGADEQNQTCQPIDDDWVPNVENGTDLGTVKVIGTWFNTHLDIPTGESIDTGMQRLKNWWKVQGEWTADDSNDGCMVGILYAMRNVVDVGDKVVLTGVSGEERMYTVNGIFDSGSDDDVTIYVPLHEAQELAGIENAVSRIEVSALTTPDNELSRKAARNPLLLTLKEKEIWYCTAYVSSICYQLQEVITDSVAKPIRQVAESEGDILNKTTLLMVLITILSMLGSALGISNIVTAGVMERRAEIGLKKALGAGNLSIILSMLTEIVITGIIGGAVGYVVGLGITQIIGYRVFGSSIPIAGMVIPIVAIMILLVSIIGSIPAIKYLLRLNPTEVLHGR